MISSITTIGIYLSVLFKTALQVFQTYLNKLLELLISYNIPRWLIIGIMMVISTGLLNAGGIIALSMMISGWENLVVIIITAFLLFIIDLLSIRLIGLIKKFLPPDVPDIIRSFDVKWLLLIYRFIPFARWFTIYYAINHATRIQFITFSAAGGVVWVLVWFIVGKLGF
jgi:hypothetical protein